MHVLTINGGSSSIKFALFAADQLRSPLVSGKIERIGLPGSRFLIHQPGKESESREIKALDHRTAGVHLIDWLEKQVGLDAIAGVGHRVVHGGPRFSDLGSTILSLGTTSGISRRMEPSDASFEQKRPAIHSTRVHVFCSTLRL